MFKPSLEARPEKSFERGENQSNNFILQACIVFRISCYTWITNCVYKNSKSWFGVYDQVLAIISLYIFIVISHRLIFIVVYLVLIRCRLLGEPPVTLEKPDYKI